MQQSTAPFKVVRIYDPAIDVDDHESRARYMYDRDFSRLKFTDGERPLIFLCRRLTVSQQRIVGELGSPAAQYEKAFAFGVVEVQNFDGPNGPCTFHPKGPEDGKPMSDDDLGLFGWDDRQEIGSVVRAQSFLARGLRLRLQPLDSSLAALTMALYQCAARTTVSPTETVTASP